MKLASVVDHIQPVTQGGAFWVETNWQPLCASCHSKKTQADRKR
jgi:5-methylcytosine-specific restriction protein A